MRTIWVAFAGWALIGIGAVIASMGDGRHLTDGPALIACGIALIVARAAAVRFDRLHPPK